MTSTGWLRTAAALALSALAGACNTSGGDFSPGALVSGGRDLEAEKRTLEQFSVVQVCPEVQVRDGTQLLRLFEKGRQGDLSAVRFQATVQKFARECRNDGNGGTIIKVGTSGRVLAGPSGASGPVNLPVRVVVVKNGSEVLFSQLYSVNAEVPADTGSVAWTQIADGIQIPYQAVSARFVIYVGFDESGKP